MVSPSSQALAATDAAAAPAQAPKRAPRGAGFTGTYRLLVRGKNINQNTLLATDYLNHFNEIIMLLEMLPSMPECYGDAVGWRPKSYTDHFRDSGFSDAELAILAYENAPENYRQAFDATIEQMDRLVLEAMPRRCRSASTVSPASCRASSTLPPRSSTATWTPSTRPRSTR
jgi:hypothetical protein